MRNVPADNKIVKAARWEETYDPNEDRWSFGGRAEWTRMKAWSARKPRYKNHRRNIPKCFKRTACGTCGASAYCR